MEKILNQRNNSYIPSMPGLNVPDHVKHISYTAKFMVLGIVASIGKKWPNEWVTADAYIKTSATMNKKDMMIQIMQHLVMRQRKHRSTSKENMLNFWGKDLWAPKTPDINFLECSILAYIEQMAC